MNPRLFDAHNHLQDERFKPYLEGVISASRKENVQKMVINGSSERDWPEILSLARRLPEVVPSFGLHPWYVKERSIGWQQTLVRHLDQLPAGIGEIGLDRWIKGHDLAEQTGIFTWQLQLAAERNLPVSIHCLQAWGKLLEILEAGPRPSCGFVLHSFGGPREMIAPLAALGGYFSLPGYFAHHRKSRQRETFRHVPPDRLLIETDAPDQPLPEPLTAYPLIDSAAGKPINHPANLHAVYRFAAELLGESIESLAVRIEGNFRRLFGGLLRS
jgi:TatD DNase family protein